MVAAGMHRRMGAGRGRQRALVVTTGGASGPILGADEEIERTQEALLGNPLAGRGVQPLPDQRR
jgi:hypothetical protein